MIAVGRLFAARLAPYALQLLTLIVTVGVAYAVADVLARLASALGRETLHAPGELP